MVIFVDFTKGNKFDYSHSDDNISGKFPVQDTVQKSWQHLNFFEHSCHITARVPRVTTDDGKVRLITTPWEVMNSGFALLFEALLLQRSSNMPVNKVSKLTGIFNFSIWELLKRYVNRTLVTADYSLIEVVGIDETSSKKGNNYVTLFVDLNERKVIFKTEGKSNETVINFLQDLQAHHGNADNIRQVCCDMSPALIKGVQENLSKAELTFDKFHIVKIINEAVDQVRRE